MTINIHYFKLLCIVPAKYSSGYHSALPSTARCTLLERSSLLVIDESWLKLPLSSCSHIFSETCKYVSRATRMRWIGHDKISPRLCHTSDGRDTSVWVQPSLKQKWQFWINELDETKDLNTVSLATCKYPGTISLGIWLEGKMTLINCWSILGSASEPVSVITIYQDLGVKEAMKITTRLEQLSWKKTFHSLGIRDERMPWFYFHCFTIYLHLCPALHVHTIVTQIAWYCKQWMNILFRSSGT